MSSYNGRSVMVNDGHEERIQSLETGYREVSTQVAEYGVKIEFLGKSLEEKLESIGERLGEKLDNTAARCESIAAQVSPFQPRLDALEKAEAARIERKASLKKITIPMFLAGGGVIATKLAEMLWTFLSHH